MENEFSDEALLFEALRRHGLLTPGLRIRPFSIFREISIWWMRRVKGMRPAEIIWSYDGGDLVYISRHLYRIIQKRK